MKAKLGFGAAPIRRPPRRTRLRALMSLDVLLRRVLKCSVVGETLALTLRHLMWLPGTSHLRDALFRSLPRSGKRSAGFGGGRMIMCDLAVGYDRSVYAGREEIAEIRLVERLLTPGSIFIDCGANIGLFTIFAASRVKPLGRIVSIEPVPSTFARLDENVRRSGVEGVVRLVNKALADNSSDIVVLSGEWHNIMQIGGPWADGSVQAHTITLDDLIRPDTPVAGLKVDVEGYELAVLRGGESTIRRWSPWILIEFNSELVGDRTLQQWGVHQFLRSRRYSAHLPIAVLHGDFAPLPDTWRNDWGVANLIYHHHR
jgi:FkbM family methyltransferase